MLDLGVQLTSLSAAVAVMGVTWAISVRVRDASLADTAWGVAFVAIAWTCVGAGDGRARSVLLAVLVTLWGLRLAAYIGWRHDGEDRRYRKMREHHGEGFALRSLWSVFGVQALASWFVSLPLQAEAADVTPSGIGAVAVIGGFVCLGGLACEALADLQLSRWLARQGSDGGGVMDSGLWRYSRHPNYFGDAAFWWGVWIVALESGSAWWTALGPALMTFLLLRVSGVALTEKTISSRRPGYRDYVERTSAFVPLPPRR